MLRSLPAPLRLLPFCSLLLLTAAQDDCTIVIHAEENDDDDDVCPEIAEICPQLACEVFATNDDGCAVCACVVGEGEGEGEGECASDQDCAPGLVCTFYETCGCEGVPSRPNDGSDQACECEIYGFCSEPQTWGCEAVLCEEGTQCVEGPMGDVRCVPVNDELCQRNSDCREDERCNLDYCINPDCGTGTMNSDIACEPVCTHGLCEPVQQPGACTSDLDCPTGFFCELSGGSPGCDPTIDNCETDCDPSSGNDCSGQRPIAPPAFGTCVEQSPECSVDEQGVVYCPVDCSLICGADTACIVYEDGGVECIVDEPTCNTDADCNDGSVCDQGSCVEEHTLCREDADCAAGQACVLPVCAACPADEACEPCSNEGFCASL